MHPQNPVVESFSAIPEEYRSALAATARRLGAFAGRVQWHAEVDSTNDLALAQVDAGVEEGRVVIADAQRKGRGRRGRTWCSPPGAGIYASAVLRAPEAALEFVPLAAGVAVAEGIQAATGLAAAVKWPNDVCVPGSPGPGYGRKLAGVLAEAASHAGGAPYVVVGFGINVRSSVLPPEVSGRATTIETELGRPVDRGLVLAECLAALWQRFGDLRGGRKMHVAQAWRLRAAATLGRAVAWDAEGRPESGVAVDIDDDGALLVRTRAGMARIIAGEVRWI